MLSTAILTRLQAATGLDLPVQTVDKAVRARMRTLDMHAHAAYLLRLQSDADELQALIDAVVVPETWFMREAAAFAAAAQIVQARQLNRRATRILCVPCASGEEPYSLAIRLLEYGIAPAAFQLDAVDISAAALARAREALYQENAFRGTDTAFRHRYFTREEHGYRLRPHVRSLVRFARANLLDLDQAQPQALAMNSERQSKYDLVFCRNLLIYFDDATQQRAIACLHTLLEADGVLFSGHAEAPAFCRHGFVLAPYPRAFALVRAQQAGFAAASLPHSPVSIAARPVLGNRHRRSVKMRATQHRSLPLRAPAALPPVRDTEEVQRTGDTGTRLLEQAQALADRGKLDEAAALMRRCVQHLPESADAHFMLGVLCERLQDMEAAREWLRRAVYLDPHHYEALCHLALLQEQHGENIPAQALRARAARVFRRRHEGERR